MNVYFIAWILNNLGKKLNFNIKYIFFSSLILTVYYKTIFIYDFLMISCKYLQLRCNAWKLSALEHSSITNRFWREPWNRFHLLVARSDGWADLRFARSSRCATGSRFARQITLQRHSASLPDHSTVRYSAARALSQMNLSVSFGMAVPPDPY